LVQFIRQQRKSISGVRNRPSTGMKLMKDRCCAAKELLSMYCLRMTQSVRPDYNKPLLFAPASHQLNAQDATVQIADLRS
jgi:hypothetical protein